jgi:hypothetical protein
MNGNGKEYVRSDGSRFFGMSRSQKRSENILGVIQGGQSKYKNRSHRLDQVHKYIHSTQYDHLPEWSESCDVGESFRPALKRKPSIIFPFAKVFQDRVATKLSGKSSFPKFQIAEDQETEFFLDIVTRSVSFSSKMLEVAKDLVSYTSAFCRIKMVDGILRLEDYNSNYCYPQFDAAGNLESVEIKYVYETDEMDKSTGKMICRWYKLELGKQSDILYDNPEYKADADPVFTPVETVEHNLGFVQGEWFKWGDDLHSPDGNDEPVVCQISGFIDAINYNLSQRNHAAGYGMEPQLTITGMTEDEMEDFIKSSSRAWVMGREGKAEFLEVAGSGIERGKVVSDDLLKFAQHAARIVFLDPEKMVAGAQSGKAMEVMHQPMIELINELRPWMEKGMISLLQKMVMIIVSYQMQGYETMYQTPQGWMPKNLDITAQWPPVFEMTIQDMQQTLMLAVQASNANIISRYSALKWLGSRGLDFGVEDLEAEQQLINTQQRFSTFF